MAIVVGNGDSWSMHAHAGSVRIPPQPPTFLHNLVTSIGLAMSTLPHGVDRPIVFFVVPGAHDDMHIGMVAEYDSGK